MSNYFQRLVAQSGLRIQPATSGPAAASVAPAGPPPSLAPEKDLVEIHEEHVVAPPPRPSPAPPIPFPDSRSIGATPAPHPRPLSERMSETSPTPTVERESETLVIPPPPPITPPPVVPPPAAAVPTPSARPPATEPVPSVPPLPVPRISSTDASQVLQAVVDWIAAGTHRETRAAAERTEVPAVTAPGSLPAEAANQPLSPAPADPIPERVIRIVEAATRPSTVTPPAPVTASPRVAPPPPAARPARVGVEPPVQVSIGSIQVRVDAPPPPAQPLPRPARAPEPRQPSARTSAFSKLRRHYILPH